TDFLDLHPTQHLTNNHLNVFVVNVNSLQTIDLLNFVYQVFLQAIHSQHAKNIVWIQWTIHQRLARFHAIAFLHVNMRAARDVVLTLFTIITDDDQLAFALGNGSEFHSAVDFGHDRSLAGPARFEQFNHAWQTARDVLGL